MQIDRELSKVLRSNERSRLACAQECPFSRNCLGLEAKALIKLRLAELQNGQFQLTELGRSVSAYSKQSLSPKPTMLKLTQPTIAAITSSA